MNLSETTKIWRDMGAILAAIHCVFDAISRKDRWQSEMSGQASMKVASYTYYSGIQHLHLSAVAGASWGLSYSMVPKLV
jgi:hypothetical protein